MPDPAGDGFKIKAGFGFSEKEKETLTLTWDSPIVKKFQTKKIMLVKSQLEKIYGPKDCQVLRKEMERIHCEVSTPLTLENGMVYAVIVIGPKKFGGQKNLGSTFRGNMN